MVLVEHYSYGVVQPPVSRQAQTDFSIFFNGRQSSRPISIQIERGSFETFEAIL